MRRMIRRIAASCAVALAAAAAFAGSHETKLPGGGSVKIRWGDVRYRKELLAQLSPGLTWRIGSGAATRIELSGAALLGENGAIFPGEATWNLRYWAMDRWELVAFEEDDWKWSEDKRHFAVVSCPVWKEGMAAKHTEKLEVALRGVPGKAKSGPPAVTEGSGPARVELPPPVEHSKDAIAELDAAPWLEAEFRFGDLVGLVQFECGKPGEAKGARAPRGGDKAKTPLRVRWVQVPSVRSRTELVETGTDVPFGFLEEGEGAARREWFLRFCGGEFPCLERIPLGGPAGAARPPEIEGKRVAVKTSPKALGAEMKDNVLTIHLHHVDYVFEL
ncbi:MAG: hypothetical protein HMLKMBBP_01947 [Planctomycetes bacterium]|nr:hypothetical protein [Planctomycetota bacterium]